MRIPFCYVSTNNNDGGNHPPKTHPDDQCQQNEIIHPDDLTHFDNQTNTLHVDLVEKEPNDDDDDDDDDDDKTEPTCRGDHDLRIEISQDELTTDNEEIQPGPRRSKRENIRSADYRILDGRKQTTNKKKQRPIKETQT